MSIRQEDPVGLHFALQQPSRSSAQQHSAVCKCLSRMFHAVYGTLCKCLWGLQYSSVVCLSSGLLVAAVGILAAHCAQYRKARRVIMIDEVDYRLKHAQKVCPGVETVNFKEKETLKALK